MRATLNVISGAGAGQTIEIDKEIVVGREDADLEIPDEEMSRRHAALRPHDDGVEVEDFGSLNGTFVDGKKLTGSLTLSGDALVKMGTTEIKVAIAKMPAPAVTAPRKIPDPDVTAPRQIPDPAVTAPRKIPDPDVTAPRQIPDPAVTAPRKIPDPDVTAPRKIPAPDVTAPRQIPQPDVTAPRRIPPQPASQPGSGASAGLPQPALMAIGFAIGVIVVLLILLVL